MTACQSLIGCEPILKWFACQWCQRYLPSSAVSFCARQKQITSCSLWGRAFMSRSIGCLGGFVAITLILLYFAIDDFHRDFFAIAHPFYPDLEIAFFGHISHELQAL